MDNKPKMSGKILAATILLIVCMVLSFGSNARAGMQANYDYGYIFIAWFLQMGLPFVIAFILIRYDCHYKEGFILKNKFSPFLMWACILIDFMYLASILPYATLGIANSSLVATWAGTLIAPGAATVLIYLDNNDRLMHKGIYAGYEKTEIVAPTDTNTNEQEEKTAEPEEEKRLFSQKTARIIAFSIIGAGLLAIIIGGIVTSL